MPNKFIVAFFFMLLTSLGFSQEEEKKEDESFTVEELNENLIRVKDTIQREPLNILAPSKAAFYSAVLPGLGQAYNKKYWKIPILYAAIGIPVYFYIQNDREFNRFRDAFKRRLAGIDDSDTEFAGISDDGLIRAQRTLRRNKELSLLLSLLGYALNIIDANVDAHLLQYNVDENLAIKPHMKYNEMENSANLGLTLNFKF
ncbi:MAG: DUF5683 domain-containing protein [Bacteroidota bacterium]